MLRRLVDSDASFVLELVNDRDFIANVADKHIATLDAARAFIRDGAWTNQVSAGHGQFAVVLRETGEVAGICGLLYKDTFAASDIGFAFLPRFRGAGLAHEAATATMAYARNELGLTRILGFTREQNSASRRLLRDLGLRRRSRRGFPGLVTGTLVYEWKHNDER